MLFAHVIVAALCAVSVRGDWRDLSAEPPRQRFFSHISNGISQMANIVTDGMKTQTNLLSQGVTTAVGQASNMTTTAFKQTANAVGAGTQMVADAVHSISTSSINMFISMLFGSLKQVLGRIGMDVVKLPPIKTSIVAMGNLETSEGQLARLSSIVQDGPARLNLTGMAIRVAVPLKLEDLTVVYPKYTVSSWLLNIAGDVSVRVKNNSIIAYLQILTSSGCGVNIERVEAVDISGFEIEMTGLCGWCSSITTFLANFLQGIIQGQVQTAIDDGLKETLREDNGVLCSRLQS